MDTTFISLFDLADHLGLPVRWLKGEVAAGRLPHIRVKRRLMFNADAVERVLLDAAARSTTRTDVAG